MTSGLLFCGHYIPHSAKQIRLQLHNISYHLIRPNDESGKCFEDCDHKALLKGRRFTQRNRYPETGCNGTPSLSNMTGFYVNVTETFSDGARACAMVIEERYSTVPST